MLNSKVISGKDFRTTLMIKNIPNKYVKQDIMDEINYNNFFGVYDFFYLIPDLTVKLLLINFRISAIKDMLL